MPYALVNSGTHNSRFRAPYPPYDPVAMGLSKSVRTAISFVRDRPSDLKKFFEPTVGRGNTVWPRSPADMLRYGVRWDYDGEITRDDGNLYHKFQLQPNAGNPFLDQTMA